MIYDLNSQSLLPSGQRSGVALEEGSEEGFPGLQDDRGGPEQRQQL